MGRPCDRCGMPDGAEFTHVCGLSVPTDLSVGAAPLPACLLCETNRIRAEMAERELATLRLEVSRLRARLSGAA